MTTTTTTLRSPSWALGTSGARGGTRGCDAKSDARKERAEPRALRRHELIALLDALRGLELAPVEPHAMARHAGVDLDLVDVSFEALAAARGAREAARHPHDGHPRRAALQLLVARDARELLHVEPGASTRAAVVEGDLLVHDLHHGLLVARAREDGLGGRVALEEGMRSRRARGDIKAGAGAARTVPASGRRAGAHFFFFFFFFFLR